MNTTAIAIDGPAGAGKSTIARRVAEDLGFIYVDTGALYRTVAYSMQTNGVNVDDVSAVVLHLDTIKVDIVYRGTEQRVMLNGEDVSDFIRTPEISMGASKCSAIPKVREFLLSVQRGLANEHNVVMDGRDIATVVLPFAKVKIFLTASAEVRAKRRYDELLEKGVSVKFNDVLADMIQRDKQDMTRKVAPLKPSDESVIVDTSELTLEQSIEAIKSVISKTVG